MFNDARFLQQKKTPVPIDVRFDDLISTVFKLVHPLNVYPSIELTPDGIVMDVNDSHPENA